MAQPQLLRGDVVDALRTLKAQSGGVLAVMGSGVLIASLMAADLIDEYLLMVHPLVLAPDDSCSQGACTCRCGLPAASQRPPAW